MHREKIERALVRDGSTGVVLDAVGRPTDEIIRIAHHSNWHYSAVPWSPYPRFTGRQPHPNPPQTRAEIFFVRDPDRPGFCIKWGYHPRSLDISYEVVPYRLVRVTGSKTEVLWATTTSAAVPRWYQFLTMSAKWPRLPDGSDELSRSYASVPSGSTGPADGIMFQLDPLGTGEWSWCCMDMRAPIEEVPAKLLD